MQASQQRSVHELLAKKLPGPLEGNWAVTAAQVNLYYPPEPGQTRSRVVSIEVTSKGRLNLPKFDAKMQAQLEGYLVSVGILRKGQTLSAQEAPPDANAVGPAPVTEQANPEMTVPIENLNLTQRSYNCLKREGIHTVGELVSHTEQDLLDIRNFGMKSIDEVKE